MLKSEIRKDYFQNKYVLITPKRLQRPHDISEETVLSRTDACPFCEESLKDSKILEEIKVKDDRIIAIKNIYPAVSLDNRHAYGEQEVIVETADHKKELSDLSEEHIESLLNMYAKRTEAISGNKSIDYVLCFKNQGSKAGASIIHSHSQIFASELLPPDITEEVKEASAYYGKNGTCPYCDIIKKEMESPRKIYEDDNVAAFTPYASRFHYEVWIFTKRHLDNITKLNHEEFLSLAKILKKVLVKLRSIDLSYNFFLHQAISYRDQHFYIKIQPRDSIWAGVELGSGLVINSVLPEEAAEYYRE
jgi:UDPglucose--hexose-1-phosphate uridylyltransferase